MAGHPGNIAFLLRHLSFNEPIAGYTINCVTLAPLVRDALAAAIAAAFVLGFLSYVIRKRPALTALRHAMILAFFTGGLLYALHADYGWADWVRTDYQWLGGRTVDQKLTVLEGGFYQFVLYARRAVNGDYMVTSDASDNYYARRFEYFMLPHRKRQDAGFIVNIADPSAKYDPASGRLVLPSKEISGVYPVVMLGPDMYILRRR